MAKSVFWSWQSDLASRETRNVIHDALVEAIGRIATELEEAERPEIDHDTKNVPGSPEIVATIFSKIEAASAFVADVTPIATSKSGKHVGNPNVLIELGFAKRALGPEKVITVWNTAISNVTLHDLPFDMRHRRGPIGFALPIGATRAELRDARSKLANELEKAIRLTISGSNEPPVKTLEWQAHHPSQKGLWADGESALVVNLGHDGSARLGVGGTPRGYARMLPSQWTPQPDANQILMRPTGHLVPLGRFSSLDYGPTKGGFIAFRSSKSIRENELTPTATRWFRSNGEIWGVASSFFSKHNNILILSTQYAVNQWIGWIQSSGRICQSLGGSGPFHLKLGIEGISGSHWPRRRYESEGQIEAIEDEVRCEFVIDDLDQPSILGAVKTLFDSVCEAYGLPSMTEDEFDQFRLR